MLHAVGLFAVLFGTWVILSGHFTPFLLISGAVCAALTVAITLRMDLLDHRRDFLGLVWRLPFYWLWLAGQIIDPFHVESFGWALVGALITAAISTLVSWAVFRPRGNSRDYNRPRQA